MVGPTGWRAQGRVALARRWRRGNQVFRLFGYAGTGKTTLARHIAEGVDGEVAFGAFTGKAASVLRAKGCADAGTIHSMIYRSRDSDETEGPSFVLNRSGCGGQGGSDRDRRMLDGGRGSRARTCSPSASRFWCWAIRRSCRRSRAAASLPRPSRDVMLTEVHRQASDNPIIHLSMQVREGRAARLWQLRREPA